MTYGGGGRFGSYMAVPRGSLLTAVRGHSWWAWGGTLGGARAQTQVASMQGKCPIHSTTSLALSRDSLMLPIRLSFLSGTYPVLKCQSSRLHSELLGAHCVIAVGRTIRQTTWYGHWVSMKAPGQVWACHLKAWSLTTCLCEFSSLYPLPLLLKIT